VGVSYFQTNPFYPSKKNIRRKEQLAKKWQFQPPARAVQSQDFGALTQDEEDSYQYHELLVGGLEHEFYDFPYIFRGVGQPPTRLLLGA